MKTLRYLLMVVAMVSVLGVYAQGTAQFPEATMQSTSTMVGTGSSLPQAAVSGTTLAGETPGSYSPGRGHIRKVGEDDGFENEDDPETPANPFPIGDAWPLMLFLCAYVLMRAFLKRRALRDFGEEAGTEPKWTADGR